MSEERETPRPRRRHRIWRALRLAYTVFFLLFTAFLFWLLKTEAGVRFAVARLGVLMHGSFAVERATGTLWSPLHLEGLTYKTESMRVTVKSADLTWRLSELVRRRLDIVTLRAAGVRVETKPSDEKHEPVKLPDLHLPINVVVRDAEVRDLVIGGKDGAPDFAITSIALATSIARGQALHVDRLAVRAPTMTADVSGTVNPTGDYPVDLTLGWTYLKDATAYRGAGRLTGTMKALHVVHTLEAPARIGADLTVRDPFDKQEMAGTVTLEHVALRALKPDSPDVTLDGTVRIDGVVAKLRVQGALTALSPMFARAEARFDVTRNGDDLKLAAFDVRLPRTGTTASGKGTVTLGKEPKGELQVAWTNVVWPLSGKPAVKSPRGTLHARGGMAAWEASLEAALVVPQLKDGATLSFDARGDAKSATFRTFTAGLLDGKITGSGVVTYKPDIAWDLKLEGEGLNPASFAPQLPGAMAFTATTRGGMRGGLAAQVAVARLAGTLKGQPLSGSFEASIARGETDIRAFDVALGGASARVHGHVGRRLDLTFDAAVKNLGLFLPGDEGAITVRGHATGTKEFPRIAAKAEGSGLVVSAKQAATLSIDADMDLAKGGQMRADVAGTRLLIVGERSLDKASISLRGTREQHTIAIATETPTGNLHAHLAGGLEKSGRSFAWKGALDRLDAQSKVAGNWTLAGPARLAASAERAELAGFCWTSGAARLCADGSWSQAGPFRANATLAAIPLGLLSQFAPGDVQLVGRLDGSLGAEGDARALTARTRLKVTAAELRYAGSGGRQGVTHVPSAALNADLGGNGLKAGADVALDGGTIHVEASAPPGGPRGLPGGTSPLTGVLRADLRDLSFLKAFDDDLGAVQGRIGADVRIAGTWGAPQAVGAATLDVPRVDLPDEGLSVRDVKIALHADGAAGTLEGSLRSGDGTLTMTGSTAFSGTAPTVLKVKGSRVTASWTEETKLLLSPDLTVTMKGTRIDATGSVEVPWSRIVYRTRQGTVAVSKDVRYVGAPPAEPKKTREMHARVRLVLGEDVRFAGMGLDAQLKGSLLAVEEPGEATAGTGEVDVVTGTYTAYGRALTIERGRLSFAGGPLDDPAIDARVSRTATDGTVAGLEVTGTLKLPTLTLWSTPPMGQADVLAYIVLGHALGQSTPQEGNMVANAATSLGIKGANLLGKKIASRFGLEEVKIQTGDTLQEASLVVGKYLSPRLFVSYGIGLFERVSTIRIDYHVSPHWTLRAEVGEGNSGDVLYETGR